jgi:hypothetical protein
MDEFYIEHECDSAWLLQADVMICDMMNGRDDDTRPESLIIRMARVISQ